MIFVAELAIAIGEGVMQKVQCLFWLGAENKIKRGGTRTIDQRHRGMDIFWRGRAEVEGHGLLLTRKYFGVCSLRGQDCQRQSF